MTHAIGYVRTLSSRPRGQTRRCTKPSARGLSGTSGRRFRTGLFSGDLLFRNAIDQRTADDDIIFEKCQMVGLTDVAKVTQLQEA